MIYNIYKEIIPNITWFQIQKSFDNEVEISNSESDEENSGLPTNLTTEQLRAIAKKYYKLAKK